MAPKLAGKIALVTGGASGLGRNEIGVRGGAAPRQGTKAVRPAPNPITQAQGPKR